MDSEIMIESTQKMRSIDTAVEATTDLVALNNTVVNMRGVVKAAKVQVVHKLSRTIQKLKTKKGTEEQKEKNLRKAQRMLDEIFTLKELNADKVTKFALGNTRSFDEVCKQPTSSVEARSLARLAEHKLMVAKVTAFRQEHSDWQDLAAYLRTKQSGRRFKTKEQKMRAAKKGSKFLPLSTVKADETKDDSKEMIEDQHNSETEKGRKKTLDDADDIERSGNSSEVETDALEQKHDQKEHGKLKCDDDGDGVDKAGEESDVNDDEADDKGGGDDSDASDSSDAETQSDPVDGNEESDSEENTKEEIHSDTESDVTDEDSNSEDGSADDDHTDIKESPSAENTSDSDDSEADHMESKPDENERQQNSDSDSETMALVTKAPDTKSLVSDPFFMPDSGDNSDGVSHWIETDQLDKIHEQNTKKHRQWGKGWQGKPWEKDVEDKRWLRGDFDDAETDGRHRGFRSRGFGRGQGDGYRGRGGDKRGRGTFGYRGRGGEGRGHGNFGHRGHGVDRRGHGDFGHRGHGSDRRGRGDFGHRGRGGDRRGHGDSGHRGRGQRSHGDFAASGAGDSRGAKDVWRNKDHGSFGKFGGTKKAATPAPVTKQEDSSHPSWDAHRKRKQMEKSASFSGKKIKFDD